MKFCDCKDYELIEGRLVCRNCKKKVRNFKKPKTNIARRHEMEKCKEKENSADLA